MSSGMMEAMGKLRSMLQPITHNLPKIVQELGVSGLGEKCYEKLIIEVDLLDSSECIKLAISKGLGFGIIAASSVVKVPQIVKLIKSHSAYGLSFLAYFLDSTSYLISLTYSVRHGLPVSTFGETGFILVQNLVIACLILNYSGRVNMVAAFVAGFATAAMALFEPNVVDLKALSYLQAASGVLGAASKLPQIVTIWSEEGTGQLSAFTAFNFLLGSLARVFTTIQEVDDKLILTGYIAGFLLNAVIAIQMIYYWNIPSTVSSKVPSVELKANFSPSASGSTAKVRSASNRRRG